VLVALVVWVSCVCGGLRGMFSLAGARLVGGGVVVGKLVGNDDDDGAGCDGWLCVVACRMSQERRTSHARNNKFPLSLPKLS
jgi:hypothetical protein